MTVSAIEETLSIDRLRELVEIREGCLVWKERPSALPAWNARNSGRPLLARTRSGYRRVRILDRDFTEHRVVWALTHGAWPSQFIDHINGDRGDNRPENLRDVSKAVNRQNSKMPASNTSGRVGVIWYKRSGKWLAFIKANGVQRHLGYFNSFTAAIAARANAERCMGFHPNHGRSAQ